MPGWLKQAWIDWIGPERLWELYGGTEAQAFTIISGTEWLAHRGSVGRPLAGEIRVVDEAGQPVPPGTTGEIYLRRAEGTPPTYRYVGAEAKRLDDWESLGDMGWMDAEGYLYLTDRQADMILVGGANVYPAEVEAALESHPRVRSSAVIGLPDEDLGNRVHAIVQVDGDVPDAELVAHLRERLGTLQDAQDLRAQHRAAARRRRQGPPHRPPHGSCPPQGPRSASGPLGPDSALEVSSSP